MRFATFFACFDLCLDRKKVPVTVNCVYCESTDASAVRKIVLIRQTILHEPSARFTGSFLSRFSIFSVNYATD